MPMSSQPDERDGRLRHCRRHASGKLVGCHTSHGRPRAADQSAQSAAGAVEHDLVLGDVHRDALGELADRPLERLVGERREGAADVADQVVVMAGAGADRLVARRAAADLERETRPSAVELARGSGRRSPATPPARTRAQRVLDLDRGAPALLGVEQREDLLARTAAAIAASESIRVARRSPVSAGSQRSPSQVYGPDPAERVGDRAAAADEEADRIVRRVGRAIASRPSQARARPKAQSPAGAGGERSRAPPAARSSG